MHVRTGVQRFVLSFALFMCFVFDIQRWTLVRALIRETTTKEEECSIILNFFLSVLS